MRRLLIRPGAIGDFIVSLPALEFLQAEYTEVWCAGAVVPLSRFADRARSIESSGINRVGLVEASDVIAQLESFDEIHSWYGTNRLDFRDAVAGLPFHFYAALPSGADQHATDFYLKQVGAPLGGFPRIAGAIRTVTDADIGLVLHPFSGSPAKNWPLSQWQDLATRIGPHTPVSWCCGPEDSLPGAIVQPDLFTLAQWLMSARALVGNDSGITHLAAALAVPTIALFRHSDPAVWAPRGLNVTVIQNGSVEQIEAAVRKIAG